MNILLVLLSFFIIAGIAATFVLLLDMNMGEGFIISSAIIIIVMYLTGNFFSYTLGVFIVRILCAAGLAAGLVYCLITKKFLRIKAIFQPYFIVMLLMCFLGMLFFFKGEIHNADEYIQWAAAIKYMVKNNHKPLTDFIAYGSGQYLGTSVYHVFYQINNGFSEPVMYVSSFMLSVTGLLLPVSLCDWKDWKKIVQYVVLVLLSVYVLYTYRFYNLYVDMPTAGWAGGILATYIGEGSIRKRSFLTIFAAFISVFLFKVKVGLLADIIVMGALILNVLFSEKRLIYNEKAHAIKDRFFSEGIKKKTAYILSLLMMLVSVLSVLFMYYQTVAENSIVRHQMLAQESDVEIIVERIKLTSSAFLTGVFGTSLASSKIKLCYIPCMIAILFILSVNRGLFKDRYRIILFDTYIIFCNVMYCVVLYYSFLTAFSYTESVSVAGFPRYFSIMVIIFFMLALTDFIFFPSEIFLSDVSEKANKICINYLTVILFVLFLYGWNKDVVNLSTSWANASSDDYEEETSLKEEMYEVEDLIGKKKVYMINQGEVWRYDENTVLYYLDDKVNNFLYTPWIFSEDGAVIRNAYQKDITIEQLPAYLDGYKYLWIYKSDDYLKENMAKIVTNNDDLDIRDSQLYKIMFNNGKHIRLKLVCDFNEEEDDSR